MDYREFAQKVKSKHPEYQDIDDHTLAQKMVQKFPQYSDVTFDQVQPAQQEEQAPDMASQIYRPIMETGAAIGGGMLGAPLGPVGVAGGGALGYGIGKSAADLTDRIRGVKEPIQNIPEAIGETAQNAYKGAQFEATNLAAGPVIKGALNNPVTRMFGKTAAGLGQWATNIKSQDYKTLFKNPEGILPGSLERASGAFAKASKEAGIPEEMTPDQLKSAIGPRAKKIVSEVYEKIFNGHQVTAAEAQNAKQMLDSVYPNPTAKNGKLLHALDTVRDAFQEVISKESPALRDANKQYSVAKAGSKFKSIFPKTMTSRPEFVRTGLLGGLALHHPVAAAAATPIGQGIATAGAGLAFKGANEIASHPELTAPIVQKLMPKQEPKQDLKNKPKRISQNGNVYILNEQTGQYE